jgi:hypothetical protein
VDVHTGGVRKTLPIKSTIFGRWVRHSIFQTTGSAVRPDVLKMVIETMAAQAEFDSQSPQREVSLRVTVDPGTGFIYVDLPTKAGRRLKSSQASGA